MLILSLSIIEEDPGFLLHYYIWNMTTAVQSNSHSSKQEHINHHHVRVLPPRLSCSSLVSLLSRYGICVRVALVNALMTFPKQDKLLLMLVSSCKCLRRTYSLSFSTRPTGVPSRSTTIFSLPARSARLSLEL